MPTTPRARPASKKLHWGLASATAIAFSLTFVAVSLALLLGVLPERLTALSGPVDAGVVLLFVPLCALVFAIIAEVMRAAMKGQLRSATPRPYRTLSEWRPGHGEG